MENMIIGRESEKKVLRGLLDSTKPEFVALYGRRRVGKTFLINQFFEDKGVYFELLGSKDSSNETHLARFCSEVSYSFYDTKTPVEAKDWETAFAELKKAIDITKKDQPSRKIVIFFDELPWLEKGAAGFLGALDYYWNRFFSKPAYTGLILVVCGSAASWIIRKVINSKGGLHNRVTRTIRLEPFCLSETERYLHSRGLGLDRKQILELFMCIGGVPFYLSLVERGESAAQAIDRLCFQRNGPLVGEFDRLFSSLFDNHAYHIQLVKTLARTKKALTRNDILARTGLPNSGDVSMAIRELEEAGFVVRMPPFGKKKKGSLYRMIDEYVVFYLDWIEPVNTKITHGREQNFWIQSS
ncbi:MAG: hypothetical protein GF344_05040, partial [Chitinivibrionales bacterium]|nr:hypothetical protein [Chitinivibrionales bacterium]